MNYIKRFVSLAVLTAIFATGCSYDGESEPTTSATVSGTAVKGLVLGGVVNVFPVIDGVRGTTALATGSTDTSTGDYSVTVTDYEGPIFVEITSDADTQMVCDVPAGCDGTAFGANVPLDTGFSLETVIPTISDGSSTTANVSPLTDMMAAYAEVVIADASSTSDADIQAAIEQANDQVAVLFFDDVTVDITELPAVDITSTTSVSSQSNDIAVQAALISSAILSAGLDAGGSLETAINDIVSDFAADGTFVGNAADNTAIDLEQIMSETLEIVERVETELENAGLGDSVLDVIASIEEEVETKKNEAEQAGTDPIVIVVPEEADTGLGQVQAFVDDLRDVLTALGANLGDEEEPGDSTFIGQVDAADRVISGRFDELIDVLEDIAFSMGVAGASIAPDDDVTITNEGSSRMVSGTIDGITASLTVTVTSETAGVGQGTITAGSFSQGGLTMSVSGGSLSWDVVATTADSSTTEDFSFSFTDMAVALSNGGATFSGTIDYMGNDIRSVITNTDNGETETETFDSLELDLNGDFANDTADFNARLSMMLDGEGFEGIETDASESETGFVDWETTLSFIAELEGIDNSTTVVISGEASGDDESSAVGTAELEVRFNGKMLTFMTSDVEPDGIGIDIEEDFNLMIEDSFGVMLDATQSESGFSGNIVFNGTEYATVSEENDVILITYPDDSFESLP